MKAGPFSPFVPPLVLIAGLWYHMAADGAQPVTPSSNETPPAPTPAYQPVTPDQLGVPGTSTAKAGIRTLAELDGALKKIGATLYARNDQFAVYKLDESEKLGTRFVVRHLNGKAITAFSLFPGYRADTEVIDIAARIIAPSDDEKRASASSTISDYFADRANQSGLIVDDFCFEKLSLGSLYSSTGLIAHSRSSEPRVKLRSADDLAALLAMYGHDVSVQNNSVLVNNDAVEVTLSTEETDRAQTITVAQQALAAPWSKVIAEIVTGMRPRYDADEFASIAEKCKAAGVEPVCVGDWNITVHGDYLDTTALIENVAAYAKRQATEKPHTVLIAQQAQVDTSAPQATTEAVSTASASETSEQPATLQPVAPIVPPSDEPMRLLQPSDIPVTLVSIVGKTALFQAPDRSTRWLVAGEIFNDVKIEEVQYTRVKVSIGTGYAYLTPGSIR